MSPHSGVRNLESETEICELKKMLLQPCMDKVSNRNFFVSTSVQQVSDGFCSVGNHPAKLVLAPSPHRVFLELKKKKKERMMPLLKRCF